jgi:hypothetical protein
MASDRTISFDFMLPTIVRVNVDSGEIESMMLAADDLGLPEIFTAGIEIDGQETPQYVREGDKELKPLFEKLLQLVENIRPTQSELFLPFVKTDEKGHAAGSPTFGTVIGERGASQFITATEAVDRVYDEEMRERYAEELRQEAKQADIELTNLAETPITPGPPTRASGLAQRQDLDH